MLRVGVMLGLALAGIAEAQASNELTDAEKAAGWQLMFDGKSLSGWHSFRKPSITDNVWIIKDTSIYMRGPAAGALLAPEQFLYKNFEISIDWKLPDSGNSGIFLRYLETEDKESVRTGPETQICGKSHLDYRAGTSVTSPGACYAMYAPAKAWIRSAEEYNTLHVVMYEKKVAHFGNGIKLLEYMIGDSDWTAKYSVSKYNSFPLYGDVHAGKLFLQDHQSHVWYRNIKIRPLTEDPWTTKDFTWPDALAPRASSAAGAGDFTLAASGDGRMHLSLGRPAIWELALIDAGGSRRDSFRGAGTSAQGNRILPKGPYWLKGTLDGRPFLQPILFNGR